MHIAETIFDRSWEMRKCEIYFSRRRGLASTTMNIFPPKTKVIPSWIWPNLPLPHQLLHPILSLISQLDVPTIAFWPKAKLHCSVRRLNLQQQQLSSCWLPQNPLITFLLELQECHSTTVNELYLLEAIRKLGCQVRIDLKAIEETSCPFLFHRLTKLIIAYQPVSLFIE